ncbi:hypothetical protein AB0I35_02415 [Nocardia sp. NPDC050378]|uniref:hypothetical protein n=1 Tax=Nocardia sp. NPDC050378 TaxID=3155400 RepID=UPI0033CA2EC3
MSDYSFISVTSPTYDCDFDVRYLEDFGKILASLGCGDLYLTPFDAADLADKLVAALDVYASTLRAVA